jgi:hypothetical protein
MLDERNSSEHFDRDERHDTVLRIDPGSAGALALARVLERWIGHFHGVEVKIAPIREIPDDQWMWHVGIDAEATALLNAAYNREDVDEERMRRIIGLFRADFADRSALRPKLGGAPVFLGLAMTGEGTRRLKPQNLLMHLPLARRT